MTARPPLLFVPLALAALVAAPNAEARKPLERLPTDRAAALAPLLAGADLALVESNPDGSMRQVTLALLVAAPPEVVREVVWDVDRYPDFIRRLENRRVVHRPDGTVDEDFTVSYTVSSFDATFHLRRVAGTGGEVEAIEVEAIDPNDDATYRYEMLPAPSLPGHTVLVQLGYTDLVHSNDYIRSIVKRAPPMEHGLALASQLVMVRSMKARAEALARERRLAPSPAPRAKSASTAASSTGGLGLGFLLSRGPVALLRSLPSGRLADLSLVERIAAPRERVEALVAAPARWPSFMPTVDTVEPHGEDAAGWRYRLDASLPLVSWSTTFAARRLDSPAASTVDTIGLDGDFAGARQRWDLTPQKEGGTLAVLRTSENLAASSLVLRVLLSQEPSFEPGLAVALALCALDGVRAEAAKGSR